MVQISCLKIGRKRKTMMDDIPDDVVINILSRLPAKTLCRFKCVCKYWHTLIQDPAFVDFHWEQSQIRGDHNSYKVITFVKRRNPVNYYSMIYFTGEDPIHRSFYYVYHAYGYESIAACNGLICFIGADKKYLRVCNPLLDQTLTLPYFNFLLNDHMTPIIGIGVDSLTRQYKIVCCDMRSDYRVHIITLGGANSSWRTISGPSMSEYIGSSKCTNIYLNGASYWYTNVLIISFNYTEEKFSFIPFPIGVAGDVHAWRICVLEGKICLVEKMRYDSSFKVWISQGYDDRQEWISRQIYDNVQFRQLTTEIIPSQNDTEVSVETTWEGKVYMNRYNENGNIVKYLVDVPEMHPYRANRHELSWHNIYTGSLVSLKVIDSSSTKESPRPRKTRMGMFGLKGEWLKLW